MTGAGLATLKDGYEQLRCHVLAGSPGGGHAGLAVLIREGVAAWMERMTAAMPVVSARPEHRTPLTVPGPLHAGIVQILASIALGRIEETHS
jgi:hypothetical protein